MVSEDRHVLLAQIVVSTEGVSIENVEAIMDTVKKADETTAGFEIVMAGNDSIEKELERIDQEDFGIMILVTLVLALTFMLIAFRSAVAAIMPLILAIGSIFTAISVATLVSHAYPMVDFLAQVVLLMGMAVRVDYSLFIVSRYRYERKVGRPKLEAIAVASDTTGRAVFYAGITVVLSLVGLALTDSAIFVSMSVGVIIVALIALAASLTLLPALLAILGDGINRLRLPIIGRDSENNDGGIWGAITEPSPRQAGHPRYRHRRSVDSGRRARSDAQSVIPQRLALTSRCRLRQECPSASGGELHHWVRSARSGSRRRYRCYGRGCSGRRFQIGKNSRV